MKRSIKLLTIAISLLMGTSISHAQEKEKDKKGVNTIQLNLRDLSQILKGPMCEHCEKAYSFIRSVDRIEKQVGILQKKGKSKRKQKTLQKLAKRLPEFAKNSAQEWNGIQKDFQSGKTEFAYEQSVKLQIQLMKIRNVVDVGKNNLKGQDDIDNAIASIVRIENEIKERINKVNSKK